MKSLIQIITVAGLLITSSLTLGQSQSENYIKVSRILSKDMNSSHTPNPDYTPTMVHYYDARGNTVQKVEVHGSTDNKDIIHYSIFDGLSRAVKQYKPYIDGYNTGNLRTNESAIINFHTTEADLAQTAFPYEEIVYEGPTGKVIETSMPGVDYKLGAGHTSTSQHLYNVEDEVLWWEIAPQGYPVIKSEEYYGYCFGAQSTLTEDFEGSPKSGFNYSSFNVTNTEKYNGSNSYLLYDGSTERKIRITGLDPYKTYTLEFWAKPISQKSMIFYVQGQNPVSGVGGLTLNKGTSWTHYSTTFSGHTEVEIGRSGPGSGPYGGYIDDITLGSMDDGPCKGY